MTEQTYYYPVFEETGGFGLPESGKSLQRYKKTGNVIAIVETTLKLNGRDHSGFAVEVEAQDQDGDIFTVTKTRTFQDVQEGKVPEAKIIWEKPE